MHTHSRFIVDLTPGEVYALLTTERMILEHKLMSDKQVLSDLIRKRILKEHIEVQRMKESLELIQVHSSHDSKFLPIFLE